TDPETAPPPGPFDTPYGAAEVTWPRAVGVWLWSLLQALRTVCEESGLNVVLITVDARRDVDSGLLRRSHYFTDARVRSFIGDAGRYWAHQRYIVEDGRVVAIKDEHMGLPWRIL
ncbi:MAG: hypothetical protein ACHREM_14810, partial [Polyangiales bacterium]